MGYYFKPSKKKAILQNNTADQTNQIPELIVKPINRDFVILIPYLIALQLPVCFSINSCDNPDLTPLLIQSFQHNKIILNNQIIIEGCEIDAISLIFQNNQKTKQYIAAIQGWLNSAGQANHPQKLYFEHLRGMKHKVTVIEGDNADILPPHVNKTIHKGGYSTILLTYEYDNLFYLSITSLDRIRSVKVSYI